MSPNTPDDLCDVPGLKLPDDTSARLYNAFRKGPVLLNTKRMRQYGIDGIFVSRFIGEAARPTRSRHAEQGAGQPSRRMPPRRPHLGDDSVQADTRTPKLGQPEPAPATISVTGQDIAQKVTWLKTSSRAVGEPGTGAEVVQDHLFHRHWTGVW